jgi:hypothetical protein
MEKLQMDWLRSEDLKEEKNVTTPIIIIAGEAGRTLACQNGGNSDSERGWSA